MSGIRVRQLCKIFHNPGRRVIALDRVSFDASDGEFLAVLGPSGCGKSTLLRIIAGLEFADSGELLVHGKDIQRVPAQQRGAAVVFQDDALYPHRSVYDNLAFPIRDRPGAQIAVAVGAMARRMGIVHLLGARPKQLSGGERQRVALARGMLRAPQMVLFDEPLAHVDAQVRSTVREELRAFTADFGGPVMYVTHDHAEAMALADRIAVLSAGRVMQCDTPERVYDHPANTFVATFVGTPPMNLLKNVCGYRGIFGIRPEHIALERDAGDMRATVRRTRRIAADSYTEVETAFGMLCVRSTPGVETFAAGANIYVSFRPEFVRLFDPDSGEALTQ